MVKKNYNVFILNISKNVSTHTHTSKEWDEPRPQVESLLPQRPPQNLTRDHQSFYNTTQQQEKNAATHIFIFLRKVNVNTQTHVPMPLLGLELSSSFYQERAMI